MWLKEPVRGNISTTMWVVHQLKKEISIVWVIKVIWFNVLRNRTGLILLVLYIYRISFEIINSLYSKSLILVSILLSAKKELLARSFNSLIHNMVKLCFFVRVLHYFVKII